MTTFDKLKSRFNSIYVLTLSSRRDRYNGIMNQLHNIGLTNMNDVRFEIATPFPHNDIIINAFNNSGRGRFTKPNEYDCARNHYAMVKKAYDSGCESVLIMEDDIMFIKDDMVFEDYIDKIPDDFDIIQFGGFTTDRNILKYLSEEHNWVKHRDVGLWTTSMYALSKKGMEYFIAFMDRFFWVADGPLYKAPINDHIVNTYMPTMPLVIQADKNIVSSNIRTTQNDTIDYTNENKFEINIDIKNYFNFIDK